MANPQNEIKLVVGEDQHGLRLDQYLAKNLPDLSRSRLKSLIKQTCVTLSGETIEDPNHRVNRDDEICLSLPEAEDAIPLGEAIPLNILHEDEDIIVIDKQAGLVVHPGAGNWTGTLVNALIHHCGTSLSGIGGVKRPGIVHRLDKDTSGVMIIAKNDQAHGHLSAQFADHGRTGDLRRSYIAFVWGLPKPAKGKIEADLGRAPNSRLKQAVIKNGGRFAITHYHVKQSWSDDENHSHASLVSEIECRLETGRTHQIRVHMAHLGHPLLGDELYAQGFKTKQNKLSVSAQTALTQLGRQALHASLLQFTHPYSGKLFKFHSDLPQDLANLKSSFGKPIS